MFQMSSGGPGCVAYWVWPIKMGVAYKDVVKEGGCGLKEQDGRGLQGYGEGKRDWYGKLSVVLIHFSEQ